MIKAEITGDNCRVEIKGNEEDIVNEMLTLTAQFLTEIGAGFMPDKTISMEATMYALMLGTAERLNSKGIAFDVKRIGRNLVEENN